MATPFAFEGICPFRLGSAVSQCEVIYNTPAALLSALRSLVTDTVSQSDISFLYKHTYSACFVLRSLTKHI